MGTPRPHTPEKLVIAILVSDESLVPRIRDEICDAFGGVDFVSPSMPFEFTRYYDREMGSPLRRLFMTVTDPVEPSRLADIKNTTNEIESRFAIGGCRRANLDPGLLSLSRFILASTKDSSHRVPLGGGVFAEVTLLFERGSWRPVEWTYPDYSSDGYRLLLREIRARFAAQMRGSSGEPSSSGPARGEAPRQTGPFFHS